MSEVRKKLIRNLLIIVGIFILVAIILMLYQGCSNNKKLSYSEIENKLKTASEKYFKKLNLLPINEGDTAIVGSEVLISNKYLKKMEDMTDDKNCFGRVTVQKNNDQYNYIPYLKCDNYETKTFLTDISSKVVTEADGIYAIDNEYVFRGEKVDNYLKFEDKIWRIIKITDDGYLELIQELDESNEYVWDNRYNVDTKDNDGIHNYEKSRIKEKLLALYQKDKFISASGKKKIVAKSICVGKRDKNNLSFNTNEECSEKLDGQYMDLINPVDIARASIDKNCNSLNNRSCSNYNYFRNFFRGSWTAIGLKGTTYKIYYTVGSSLISYAASESKNVHPIIYISANERIKSGDGSKNSPYTI